MDRVTAASSICQPLLHALHTDAIATAVRNRAVQQLNTLRNAKHKGKLFGLLCSVYQALKALCLLSLITWMYGLALN